jgi:hypothetical protein
LAANASLIYITTATQFDGADAIVSHLTKQETVVKKKAADIIGAIEGSDSLCLDVEVTLEFVSGGGAYLPSLDDNFLADRVAAFPTVCSQFSTLLALSTQLNLVCFDRSTLCASIRITKFRLLGYTGTKLHF